MQAKKSFVCKEDVIIEAEFGPWACIEEAAEKTRGESLRINRTDTSEASRNISARFVGGAPKPDERRGVNANPLADI